MIFKRNNGLTLDYGLTLIEIIIGVFLFSIIMGAIFSVLAIARTSWRAGGTLLDIQQEARRGSRTMVKELCQARLSSITGVPADGANYNSITFQIPVTISETVTTWSSDIQYSLGGLNSAQLIRTQDTDQIPLANNISMLSFSRDGSNPDVIDIGITSQKNTFPGISTSQSDITLNFKVKVRN